MTNKGYDPYGNTTNTLTAAATANLWRFDGRYFTPAMGLYHFGAGWYDPPVGRWTRRDSVVTLNNPTNGNLYASSEVVEAGVIVGAVGVGLAAGGTIFGATFGLFDVAAGVVGPATYAGFGASVIGAGLSIVGGLIGALGSI